MGEVIIDGSGNGYAAQVTSDGKLKVDATVNATAVGAATAKLEAAHTGSGDLVGMNYNGSIYPLKTFNGSHLVVAGSISSMPAISTSNVSSGKEGAAHVGSPTLIAGDYLGSLTTLIVSSGSELITTGSHRVINIVGVLGSVNVDNAVAVGSIQTQGVAGSVRVATGSIHVDNTTRQIDAGSVIVTNKVAGSIVDLPDISQGTNPWIVFGSVNVNNEVSTVGSVAITNTISTSNVSAGKEGAAHVGSPTLIGADYLGSLVSLTSTSGSELLVAGSTVVTNTVDAVGSFAITNTPSVDIGNTGSVRATVVQGTDPWIVDGSINVNNTERTISAGSVIVTNSISTSNVSAGKEGAAHVGSPTLIGGDYLGSLVTLNVSEGSELITTGSQVVTNTVDVLGSVNVNNSLTVGAGSMRVTGIAAGSVEVYQATDSELNATVTQGTDPWVVLGSARVVQDSTARQITAGSVIVTNTVDAVGSVAITNTPSVDIGNTGSVRVTNSITTTNVSSGKEGAAHVGSPTLIGGDYLGSLVTLTVSSGSELITTGSQVVTNTVDVLGSVNVNNTVNVVGSTHVTQSTDPWVILGSVNVNNSISSTNVSAGKEGAAHVGSPTLMAGDYLGSLVTLTTSAGSELITTGSVRQLTSPWIVLGSVNVDNAIDIGNTGSVRATIGAGSVQTYNPIGIGSYLRTNTAFTSSDNTTTSTLGANGSYVGTGEQNDYDSVMVSCLADASGTLFFDFSNDGSNWSTFPTAGFAVGSNIHEFHTAVKGPRYFRARYDNGADAQGTFRLYTHYGTFRHPNAPLNQSIAADADAIITRSVIAGEDATGAYQNVNITNGGNFKVALEEYEGIPTGQGTSTGTLRVSIATDDRIAGSIVNLPGELGSVHVRNTVDVLGSVNVNNTGRQITAGSVIVTSGSIRATVGAGSIQTYSPIGVGSVRIAEQGPALNVVPDRGDFHFSGANFTSSGTIANILTPGTGSKFILKGFNASALTPAKIRILFSGGTVVNTFTIPGSGTVAMNLYGMEPSGATNQAIGIGLFDAGDVDVTVYAEETL